MNEFSEKSLLALGEYYVYGLIDPRTNRLFYIGKGCGNRVFEHEKESRAVENVEKEKHKTILEIIESGLEVKKIIINSNLTEAEAFAAEAALINAFNYVGDKCLTNIVAGHHSEEALSVEMYERMHGAVELQETDVKHSVLVIKINKLYRRNMTDKELYNAVRGIWKASYEKTKKVEYVFGVYNSLIVAVYKPTHWYRCKDALDKLSELQRTDMIIDSKNENRVFFEDDDYLNTLRDKYKEYYLYKSISRFDINKSAQNPITYINVQ